MTAVPLNAKLCHRCNEQYVGRLCPKCTTRTEFLRAKDAREELDEALAQKARSNASNSTRAVNRIHEIPSGEAVAGNREGKAPAATASGASPVKPGGRGERRAEDATSAAPKPTHGVRQRKAANKTEASFQSRLEQIAEVTGAFSIEREGITLRWPDGMTYTPDFVLYPRKGGGVPKLYETKGPFIRRSGLEKFRAARAHWPMFEFELWQRDADYNWKKLL